MKNIEFYRDKLSDIETTDNVVCKACALMRNKTECIFKIMPTFERKCPNNREIVDFLLSEYTESVKLTDVERTILKNVDEEYKYIARDKNRKIFVYRKKPYKKDRCDNWVTDTSVYYRDFPFTSMFDFISFEDDEPYLIDDLLERAQK